MNEQTDTRTSTMSQPVAGPGGGVAILLWIQDKGRVYAIEAVRFPVSKDQIFLSERTLYFVHLPPGGQANHVWLTEHELLGKHLHHHEADAVKASISWIDHEIGMLTIERKSLVKWQRGELLDDDEDDDDK